MDFDKAIEGLGGTGVPAGGAPTPTPAPAPTATATPTASGAGMTLTPARVMPPSSVPAAGMTDFDKAIAGLGGAAEQKAPPQERATVRPPGAITRRAPPQPLPGTPEPTFGEASAGAVQQFLPSLGNAFMQLGHAALSPVETIKGMGRLLAGAGSKAAGAAGVEQDPNVKAQDEATINAMIDDYAKRYGSWGDFKRAMMTDPASIVLDLTTLISGGATGVAKAAGQTSRLGAIAGKAAAAAEFVDPINAAVRAVGASTGLLGKPIRAVLSKTSGVPKEFLDIASGIADKAPAAGRDAFFQYLKGAGNPADLKTRLDNAFVDMRRTASRNFMAQFPQAQNARVNMSDALNVVDSRLNQAMTRGSVGLGAERISKLQDLRSAISEVVNNPNRQSLESVHDLKIQLDQEVRKAQRSGENLLYGDLVELRRTVRDTLADPARGGNRAYDNLMESYQTARNEIADLESLFGGRGAASAKIAAAIRNIKKSPQSQRALDELAKLDPELPGALAGASMRGWDPSGAETLFGALGGMAGAYFLHPAALGAVVPTIPRAVGTGLALSSYGKKGVRAATGFYPQRAAYAGSLAAGLGSDTMTQQVPAELVQRMGRFDERQTPYDDVIRRSAEEAGIDPVVYKRLIGSESNFEPDAVSYRGKKYGLGPAQIAAVHGLTDEQRLNPDIAFPFAAQLLRKYVDEAGGDYEQAILRYKGAESDKGIASMTPITRAILHDATAPREQRASGGKVMGKQAMLVDRLMQRVRQAHKARNEETKPLLQVPDEAVASALAKANEAI